jgi:hypothetical protein
MGTGPRLHFRRNQPSCPSILGSSKLHVTLLQLRLKKVKEVLMNLLVKIMAAI